MKLCRNCEVEKPASDFGRDARYRDGLASWCRQCFRDNNKKWAKQNRERLTKKARVWRENNPDAWKQTYRGYHERNKGKRAEQHAAWAKRNRGMRNATSAKRKAAKISATPPWADAEAIAQVYKDAAARQDATGIKMHVDHIVPLQHNLVCGLHVHHNLQVLTASQNVRKKNKWQGDLFVEPAPPKPEQSGLDLGDAA